MRAHAYRIAKPPRTPLSNKSPKASRLSLLLAMLYDAGELAHSSSSSSSRSQAMHQVPADECSRAYYYCPSARYDEDASPPRTRQPSISSVHSCEGLSPDRTRQLWMCMLELQMRYGCYNSTRMDLAVQAGDDAVDLMPNPFILDTLNDSVVDLPEEGWEMLTRHLQHDAA